MELLYVWIKEYKNIKEQGFNFSPKWRFHYDPISGKLDVEDRRDKVIDNFFGEHISNVTAIVGENGSGKSSLLEFVMSKFYWLTGFWNEPFIFIINLNGKLKAWKHKDIKLTGDTIEIVNFLQEDSGEEFMGAVRGNNEFDTIQCFYYSNFYTGQHLFENIGRNNHFFDQSTNKLNYWAVFKKEYSELENSRNDNYIYTELQKQIKFIGEGGNNITGLKLPTFLKVIPSKFYRSESIIERLEDMGIVFSEAHHSLNKIDDYFSSQNIVNQFYSSMLLGAIFELLANFNNCEDYIIKISNKINLQNNNTTYLDFKEFQTIGRVNHLAIISLTEWIEGDLKDFIDEKEKCLYFPTNGNIAITFITMAGLIGYEHAFPFEFSWHYDKNNNAVLSSGEIGMLSFFSRLFSVRTQFNAPGAKFVFIDEFDLGYHPQWQKGMLNLTLNNLPYNIWLNNCEDKSIHIILTTHSPFLLSDLPKENVIFLKKGDDGNCQVVDGLNKMKQTFGANIHTLLSDSFFMDDLTGDFAKEKIDKVIRYLNKELKDGEQMADDEAEKIINMIGEPILKRHLEQQFQYKRQNKEIEELKERVKSLEQSIKKGNG